MSSYINCCPIPTRANNTNIKAWLTGLTSPDAECGAALAAGSLPLPRNDNGGSDCYDPTVSCGANGMGYGPWPAPFPAQTFATGAPLMSNLCSIKKGFKVVQAKKYWTGRYGFKSDYVANPKVDTKYQQYSVNVAASESGSYDSLNYDSSGNETAHLWGKFAVNGQADSVQKLTVGAVTDCTGHSNPTPGTGENHGRYSDTSLNYDWNYYEIGGPGFILAQTDYQALIDDGHNDYYKNKNTEKLKYLCGINSDRAIVRIPFPWGNIDETYYEGPIDGFPAWVASHNVDSTTTVYTINGPRIGGAYYSVYSDDVTKNSYAVSDWSVTETEINFKIQLTRENKSVVQLIGLSDPEPETRPPFVYGTKSETHYTGIYQGSAKLASPYTAQQCQKDCVALLNEWDMTDDAVYPWRTDSACNVAPMVILKENNGGIGWGYCDVPADSNSTTKFDGSIYGKPMAAAYYDKGWFDFYADKYAYSLSYNGDVVVCFEYGQYAPDGIPTTATHWTDGANDTHYQGGFWQPFSRFKVNYIYDLPPFVNHGCAFVANNQEAFWAAKWAEIKEPLPSQNYTAPCGPQPNQCAIDSHGGAFGDCSLMSSLYVLDANCQPTSTLRYPGAPSTCSVDLSPKGYYVRSVDFNGALSAQEGNVKPIGQKPGIIAILPPGSPELGKWPAATTNFYSDYPSILPTEHWYSAVQQAMSDRFWIDAQDAKVSDEVTPDPACARKNKDGSPCTHDYCDPVTTPLVEARLYAPAGAALQFLTDQYPQWNKMPGQSDWSTTCSAVWNYGQPATSFTAQPGVATNYADSLNTNAISSDTDAGWGLADSLFIP